MSNVNWHAVNFPELAEELVSGCCSANYWNPNQDFPGAEVLCLNCHEYTTLVETE